MVETRWRNVVGILRHRVVRIRAGHLIEAGDRQRRVQPRVHPQNIAQRILVILDIGGRAGYVLRDLDHSSPIVIGVAGLPPACGGPWGVIGHLGENYVAVPVVGVNGGGIVSSAPGHTDRLPRPEQTAQDIIVVEVTVPLGSVDVSLLPSQS